MKLGRISFIAVVIGILGVLILSFYFSSQRSASPSPGAVEMNVTQGTSVVMAAPSPGAAKGNNSKLEDRLAQLAAAFRAGDQAKLNALADARYVDLKNNTVRVILEMDSDPDAHTAGAPTVESVTLSDGRKVEIQHAPTIVIRADLAQVIAAAGATYETASQNLVQVLAPLGGLEALTKIPGVRYVRLPYSVQP